MKVESNGIVIHVEEQGSGDLTLVFLHYWGGSTHTWKYVTASLAKSYRTVALDHRGWGDSDAPATGYTLADHAADALGVIDALGVQRYIVIGHSMGGKVAQFLASRRPTGLVGLVLLGSALPTSLEFPPEVLEAVVKAYSTRASVDALIDQMLITKPINAADREQVIVDSLRGAPQAKEAWPRRTGQEDISAAVSAIEVPTLAIYGEFDQVHTAESAKAELIPRIPNAVLQVLSATGHLSPLESPTELVVLIDQFAAGLS
jgi:pimeloyl-ACP methyl ester carboxylesterase